MPDKLTVDKILGHDLYAKGSINAYDIPNGNVKKTFTSGDLIGSIWSWVVRDGDIWYQFYLTNYDYQKMIPTWVKDQPGLYLPDAPQILQQIQEKADQEKRDRLGVIPYYIEKYMPWIVGGVVVAVAAPALLKSSNKNVSGMSEDQKNLLGLGGTALLIYFLTKKKRSGSLEIGDPYDGKFEDDAGNDITIHTDSTNVPGGNTGTVNAPAGQQMLIDHIGVFPVVYRNQQSGGLISGAY